MRPVAIVAIVVALSLMPPAVAKPKQKVARASSVPVASPQVAVVESPDGRRTDLSFDGPLLGWALPRSGDERRTLYILIGPKRESSNVDAISPSVVNVAPRASARDARLFRWRSEFPDRLDLCGSGLPEGELESADLDGDGVDELLFQRAGGIDLITAPSEGTLEARSLLEDSALGQSCCGPRLAWNGAGAEDFALRLTLAGAFRTYRVSSSGGFALASEGRMLFATHPEALGNRRLRIPLLDPDGPVATQLVESWALFPGPERVLETKCAVLDGAPVFIVTTISAEKLSVFGEKAIRVYPLSGNRTRAGDTPIFAATSGMNLWQGANPAVVDLDGDGRDDLVLSYWKGLKNSVATLEVYRGGIEPRFANARSMSFDVEGGEKEFLEFGGDADGDGRPDMIALAKGELLLFPGRDAAQAAEKPVATRPSRRIALPAGFPGASRTILSMGTEGLSFSREPVGLGNPHLLDLDGDHRPEVLFAGDDVGGAGRISIVGYRGSSPLAASDTIPRD